MLQGYRQSQKTRTGTVPICKCSITQASQGNSQLALLYLKNLKRVSTIDFVAVILTVLIHSKLTIK